MQVSNGDFTVHHGDTCLGEVVLPWWCSRWLAESVVSSRGFCDVEWKGDVMTGRFCDAQGKFHAPRIAKWVVVKHVDGM